MIALVMVKSLAVQRLPWPGAAGQAPAWALFGAIVIAVMHAASPAMALRSLRFVLFVVAAFSCFSTLTGAFHDFVYFI